MKKPYLVKKKSYKTFSFTIPYPCDMPLDAPDIDEILEIYGKIERDDEAVNPPVREALDYKIENTGRRVTGPFGSKKSAEERIEDLPKNLITRLFGERNHNIVKTCEGFVIFYDVYKITVIGRYCTGEVLVEK